jgi:hypothetical protein
MSTINDLELCRYRQVIAKHHKRLDELTANGEGAELMRAYHAIELAAQLAQQRLGEVK